MGEAPIFSGYSMFDDILKHVDLQVEVKCELPFGFFLQMV
jgi:hypothetical protein